MQDAPTESLGQALLGYLRAHQDEMVALLETLVRAESPSTVPVLQAAVQRPLRQALEAIDFRVEHIPGRGESGGHLYARPRERTPGAPIQLLVGHTDTVWPVGTLQKMPFRVQPDKVQGPGVFDMKGGLTQMIWALRALDHLGVTPAVTPVVFINSDEEIGSDESESYIRMLARRSNRCYVMEPALDLDGKLKTARRGAGRFFLTVRGRSAHAGIDPESGASAILELSHVIQKLHGLNDFDAGISINVGHITGGTRSNVIADESSAEVDVRVRTKEQAREVEQAINALSTTTEGTVLDIEGEVGRPPMERTPRNQRLWDEAQRLGTYLGVELIQGRSGGTSDGNTTSLLTATLDGLGAVGDGAHARHEFLYPDKMVERAALLALLVMLPPLDASARDADAEAEVTTAYAASSA
ncbi:MAG: M20/M25/M40 family metallo-hydrolase [Bacteroidetes bacterium]|jgi:glutamate carboxypeptidase|nr:M20/M25/M40 family metallo-hydrolase [Bacteroidota bacterium]